MREFAIAAEQKATMILIFFTADENLIELLLEKKGLMAGILNKTALPLTLVIDEDMANDERRQAETKRMLDTAAPKNGSNGLMNVPGRTLPVVPSKFDRKVQCHRGTEISGSSAAVRFQGTGRSSETPDAAPQMPNGHHSAGGSFNNLRFGEAKPQFTGRSFVRGRAHEGSAERDLLQGDNSFEFSEMTRALNYALSGTRDSGPALMSAIPTSTQADEYQLKVGSHGEHMVRRYFPI